MSTLHKKSNTMQNYFSKRVKKWIAVAVVMVAPLTGHAGMEEFISVPPLLSNSDDPLVMLVMSNDNQMWHKAYTDYSDLDNDGTLETTYNDGLVYYGYFNSDYCYSYVSGYFSPKGKVALSASDITVASPTPNHSCAGAAGSWSGNFMNWMTMTRMDVIRKVLYGGYRSTDTESQTILQRALLPDDNHAFVKVAKNSDITGSISDYTAITSENGSSDAVSFCNVTSATSGISGSLNVATHPPVFKVAKGDLFTWSGSERNLCMFEEEVAGDNGDRHNDFIPSRPTSGSIGGISQFEFNVRVETCVSGQDQTDCRQYVDGENVTHYKPYGLLQSYGENGGLQFGLMTGSYINNHKGGVLRKNVSYMGGESAANADIEIDSQTGQFVNQGTDKNGIINTLNRLRIQGWNFGTNFYEDCGTWGITMTQFLSGSTYTCKDWGNPLAELYLEALRYFAGATAGTTEYGYAGAAKDSIDGLTNVNWSDPMSGSDSCANCAIVLLSTGVNTFDGDNLVAGLSGSTLPGLSSLSHIEAYTDIVGDGENITNNTFLVGNTPADPTDSCSAKTITKLSDATGICPEVPSLKGTYNLAGLAHYGFLKDLRSLEGEQNVSSYMLALAESVPTLEVTTSNKESVRIVPYCTSTRATGETACSLVDITTHSQTDHYAAFYIAWEDSLWGSDFDMDVYMVLEYCTATGSASSVQSQCGNYTNDSSSNRPNWAGASTGEIQIRISEVANYAGGDIALGFVMNGSNRDATYTPLIEADSNVDFNSVALTGSGWSAYNKTQWGSVIEKFTAAAGTPGVLENPLWYAAKYGNFNDINNNNLPDLTSEWDKTDVDGSLGADGIPDAYFPVRNPAKLESRLARVFGDITKRVSSGTAASVVASTGAGQGAVYQALYNPVFEVDTLSGNTRVTWAGTLHSLFIDDHSELREDLESGSEVPGQLTSSDPIVEIYYDEGLERTMVQRYAVNADGTRGSVSGAAFDITDLQPIWSARDQLAAVESYTENRNYGTVANKGRYLFTGVDNPSTRDGQIDLAESVPFEASQFATSGSHNFRLLDYGSDNTALENLVNYIRGDESNDEFRSRTIEWDGNTGNGEEPWLLGDIVNSSPVALARPGKGYDVSFGDNTYLDFKKAVEDRRQVVMLGANDGMIHAFNAGFYDSASSSYKTSINGRSAHPLGSELWGYIPYNLLPHLQYLSQPEYAHVYYVDGQPQIFDVNGIWSSASKIDHPEGWGNILVVGMRFGGGEVTIDPDSARDSDTSDDITLRSGYVILDITDPESPPEIIAEITDEDLGYSVSIPTLVKFRAKNSRSGSFSSPAKNEWFLVFGSGPAGDTPATRSAALQNAVSEKTAKVFAFNLRTKALQKFDTTIAKAFVGGVAAGDWNNDFEDDAIYFGVVGGTEAAPTGQLMRGGLTLSGSSLSMSFSQLINVTNQPFSAPPSLIRDRSNNFWVYSGTGRYYTSGDNGSSTDQTYYGIKDPDADMKSIPGTLVSTTTLVETTDIDVYTDGSIKRGGSTPVSLNTGESVETFSDVMSAVADHSGWFFDFPYDLERNTTKAELSDESLIFTTYQPTGEVCDAEGSGYLYAPHYQVGIPGEFAPLGKDSSVKNGEAELVEENESLGTGNPSTPTIYQDADGNSRAIIQTSTGEIVNQEIQGRTRTGQRQSWREIPIDW